MKENGGVPTAATDDPRLTRWGKWLRRFKIDELPTLVNLFRGDITLVGPRPDTLEEIESLDEETRRIVLSVKPGIISPATIWNYSEDKFLEGKENPHQFYLREIKPIKYKLNVWYVQRKSIWFDFRVIMAYILRTLRLDYKWLKILPNGL